MDNTELHYLTYAPDAIWEEMMTIFAETSGSAIYPGDEKDALLRAVMAYFVHAFAGVDNALRLSTLRYAVGEYLDDYGSRRFCSRIEATAATATVEITFKATGKAGVIAKGTAMTADGEHIYLLDEDVEQSEFASKVSAKVICNQTGSVGNGLLAGTQIQTMTKLEAIESIYVTSDAAGGQDREKDDVYRLRIRESGLTAYTTGPAARYRSAAMSVSSEIADARATNLGAGVVGVYLLLKSSTGASSIMSQVEEALSADDVRPLTDTVHVYEAAVKEYKIKVQCAVDSMNESSARLNDAIREYQEWQENTIGRAFNPEKLRASLYVAGATRVEWMNGSHFDTDGEVKFTAIDDCERCKGEITLEVVAV